MYMYMYTHMHAHTHTHHNQFYQLGGSLPGMGDLNLVNQLSVLIFGGPKREVRGQTNFRKPLSPQVSQLFFHFQEFAILQ